MNKVYLDENIFYVDDFISKKDIEYFLTFMKDDEEIHYSIEGTPSQISIIFKHDGKADKIWKDNYSEKINLFIDESEYFETKNAFSLIKYKTSAVYLDQYGNYEESNWLMIPHKDEYESCTSCLKNGFLKCIPNCTAKQTKLTKGFVIYLTDDFDGGEIEYVNKNITVKPKAGRLVMHPGNEEYSHGVKHFYGGDRIIYSGFVHKKQ